jgi:hypothetical protein
MKKSERTKIAHSLLAAADALEARLKVKAVSGDITATTPPPKLLRLAKDDVEKSVLYYTGKPEAPADLVEHEKRLARGYPDKYGDGNLSGMDAGDLKKVMEDMANRGLLVQVGDKFERGKDAMDFGEAREQVYKAFPLAKALYEHLQKLEEMVPETHRSYENIKKAMDMADDLIDMSRTIRHSFE